MKSGGALTAAALVLICIVGAYFRFLGLDWDQGQHLHPDERFMSMVESAIRPATSPLEYLDTAHSPLNPYNRGHKFYPYGHFPLIVVQYVASWFGLEHVTLDSKLFGVALGREFAAAYLIGRALSAVCDLVSLLMLFLIGRSLYDSNVALLAAALYAVAVLPIQQSHFFTVDAWTTAFVVVAFSFAVRATAAARWSDDILGGLSFGLALASKISVAPLGMMLPLAIAQRIGAAWKTPARKDALLRGLISVNVAALAAVLAFRLGQPYAFLPPRGDAALLPNASVTSRVLTLVSDVLAPSLNPAWLKQMDEVSGIVSASNDTPPGYQWAQRPVLMFPWLNMVRFGMGWPLGLAAWCGWSAALWEMVRRRPGWQRHILPVAWIGGVFIWQGSAWVKSMRYFLPLYPFLVLMAAWGLVALAARLRSQRWHFGFALSSAPIVVVLLATCAWAFAYTRIYTRPITRVAASQWIFENAPSDVTLYVDTPQGECSQQIGMYNDWKQPTDDSETQPSLSFTRLERNKRRTFPYSSTCHGALRSIAFHAADVADDSAQPTLLFTIAAAPISYVTRIEATQVAVPSCQTLAGDAYHADLPPLAVAAGEEYELIVQPGAADVFLGGATIATEGNWEDWVPLKLDGRDAFGAFYQGYGLQTFAPDGPSKRIRMQYILDRADFLVISSNRFYDSLTRIPSRWPMTIDYYRALFGGELGFDLVGDFRSQPNLGPFEFEDRGAEEAFSVYDHPRVFVFKRSSSYDPDRTAEILGRADLARVTRLRADQSVDPPVRIELPPPSSSP